MLNHSVSVSAIEEELGFAIYDLPSTEDAARWNGSFTKICAKQIDPSCYVMKFDGESGAEYYQFKWGVAKNLPWLSPMWVPAGRTFTDPEMAIHSASLDMSDFLNVIEHALPSRDNSN